MKGHKLLAAIALFVYGLSGVAIQREFDPNLPLESNLLIYGGMMLLKSPPTLPPVDLKTVEQARVLKIVILVDEKCHIRGMSPSCGQVGSLVGKRFR